MGDAMRDLLSGPALFLVVIALWVVLQRFVLPRLGVDT
jgi:hypothetical protein